LEGSEGTTYDGIHTGYTYAHIDGGVENPGYLSEKTTTGMAVSRNAEMKGRKPIFNLSGQRLSAPQRGVNIVDGTKMVVK
jgi:hypothetical protein